VPKEDWTLKGQYSYIEFKNESRIDLLDLKFLPSDPLYERFGSLEYSDGAIEETGEIDFLAYDVLKTRIGRHLNKELGIRPTIALTGNPKKNWTYTTFYQPWKNGTLPANVKFIQALYGDNPYTATEYEVQLQSISDINPTFQNLKSECGYKLAELAGGIWIKKDLPDKEKEAITLELGMLRTYESDKDGKLRLMPKEKIKEYIGRSPDWLDCFIMRMWFETQPQKKYMSIYELSQRLP